MLSEQFKQSNLPSLNPRSHLRMNHPLSTTSSIAKCTRASPEDLMQRPSNVTAERCCFLLLQLFLYSLIFVVLCVQIEQLNDKQARILSMLGSTQNLSHSPEPQKQRNADCSCQPLPYPKRNHSTRCLDLRVGSTETIFNVFCPISANEQSDHRWLVIQDRRTNQISFNRTWIEYQRGFGNVRDQVDFWIGNENLYWLTNNYQCRLKIELTDWHNETRKALYEWFHVSNQNDDYRIQLDGYHGNMEAFNKFDSFTRWHNNAPFSTFDHYATDNANCPHLHGGTGWWYYSGSDCAHVQLNGYLPTHADGLVPLNSGIMWIGWKADRHYSFQQVRMAIQPKLWRERGRRRRR